MRNPELSSELRRLIGAGAFYIYARALGQVISLILTGIAIVAMLILLARASALLL
mgnify:CR=1 FL=1